MAPYLEAEEDVHCSISNWIPENETSWHAVMIEPTDLEDYIAYCWTVSVGMPGSKYVEEAWAR